MNDAPVASRVSGAFLAYLKAEPEVGSVFFKNEPGPGRFPNNVAGIRPLNAAWMKSISVALVCTATAKLVVRNFNKLIDRDRVNGFLDRELAPNSGEAISAGVALYDSLFAAYAASRHGVSFQNYLADRPAFWGDELACTVMDPTYRDQLDIKYNVAAIEDRVRLSALLHLIVYMVGRLNPAERDNVAQTFRDWYPQAFSEIATSRLIRSDYNDASFFDAVTAVASVRTLVPPARFVSSEIFVPPTEYRWGTDFLAFLHREAGAFRTSVNANSWEVVTLFSCFTCGTPVQLADGSTKPIELVSSGDPVLAVGGEVSIRAPENSVHKLEVDQAIYGINDTPPFFSAAHTFLSTTGMKAIDPVSARAINPDLKVDELKVGDTVFRLVSTQPFALEELTLERISVGQLAAGESLHALVLDGPQTYFAGGFCVSANYPVLTEERIANGIAALSEQERGQLGDALRPVMPLLLTVLRGFAGPRLQDLLTTPVEPEAAQ